LSHSTVNLNRLILFALLLLWREKLSSCSGEKRRQKNSQPSPPLTARLLSNQVAAESHQLLTYPSYIIHQWTAHSVWTLRNNSSY
jgi:hypothetical protein